MAEYIKREAAIAYIRKQSEECQKAFEELGGESGIYADAYNDLAEDFYTIPAADVVPVVRCKDCIYNQGEAKCLQPDSIIKVPADDDYCSYGKRKTGGVDNDGK